MTRRKTREKKVTEKDEDFLHQVSTRGEVEGRDVEQTESGRKEYRKDRKWKQGI